MKVIFFEVDGVLNFPGCDAKAPDGTVGIAESRVKKLKQESEGFRIVLTGSWAKDWDFGDAKCTARGAYLNKKLNRRGLHILDKTDDIKNWLERHPNVDEHIVLKEGVWNDE